MRTGKRLSHYQVGKEIGRGGMGEVFEAWDSSLDRKVALKFLRAEEDRNPHARKLLVREARAAASLDHPYICKVLEVVETEDECCIVMEMVEGQTLRDQLARGPMQAEEALAMGAEVAEALHFAHQKGLLHRDLKPSNIILTEHGHAKVMDFGLAKRIPASDPAETEARTWTLTTKEAGVKGTWSYMSPEQIRGEELDARSDIFALGVVLSETLTGEHPFARGTPQEIASAILNEPPRAEAFGDDSQAEVLRHVVGKMLSKDPKGRHQSAQGVAADLTGIQRRSAAQHSVSFERRRHRVWTLASALAALAVLAMAGWLLLSREGRVEFAAEDRVLVGEFENTTGNELLDGSLDRGFRVALEQSRYADVVAESEMRRGLQRMEREPTEHLSRETLIELCQREGIPVAVVGRILEVGRAYRLTAEILDCQSDKVLRGQMEPAGNVEEILPALERLARRVRGDLGESLQQIEESTRPLQRVTTSSLEALQSYSIALDLMGRGRDPEGIALLERALELDPDFAMAHARLAAIYGSMGLERDRAIAHADAALDRPHRLTQFEELYVRGSRAWYGTYHEALDTWFLMTSLFPAESVGHHNLGLVHWMYERNFEQAEPSFAQSTRLSSPRRFVSFHHLGYSQLGLERLDEALTSFERAWSMEENPIMGGLGDGLAALRDYEAAESFLEAAADATPFAELYARSRLAALRVDRGELAAATLLYEEGMRRAGNLGVTDVERQFRWARLVCLAASHPGPQLDSALELEAAGLEELPMEGLGDMVFAAGVMGATLARSSRLEAAKKLQQALAARASRHGAPAWLAHAHYLQAEIELASKRPARAIAELRQALESAEAVLTRSALARAYRASGELELALEELGRLRDSRGKAFAEGMDPATRAANLLALLLVPFQQGEIQAELGDAEAAERLYRVFLDQFPTATLELPEAERATARLGAI